MKRCPVCDSKNIESKSLDRLIRFAIHSKLPVPDRNYDLYDLFLTEEFDKKNLDEKLIKFSLNKGACSMDSTKRSPLKRKYRLKARFTAKSNS